MLKVAQNAKFDWHMLRQRGVEVAPVDDTMLISYTLDSGVTTKATAWTAERALARPQADPVFRSRRHGQEFHRLRARAVDRATQYAAEDADVTLRWVGVEAAAGRRTYGDGLRDA